MIIVFRIWIITMIHIVSSLPSWNFFLFFFLFEILVFFFVFVSFILNCPWFFQPLQENNAYFMSYSFCFSGRNINFPKILSDSTSFVIFFLNNLFVLIKNRFNRLWFHLLSHNNNNFFGVLAFFDEVKFLFLCCMNLPTVFLLLL